MLPRNVIVLSWVSLFQDMASEMLYPVIPIFLTLTLGATPAIVGTIEGLAELSAALLKSVSGALADRFPKRPLVASGYGISSFAKVLLAFAGGWGTVGALRVSDRIGKGVREAPRDALIATDTPAEMRGRAFGFHRMMDTTGAVLGPLAGALLYVAFAHHVRWMFADAAIPAFASVALVFFVREPARAQRASAVTKPERFSRRYWAIIVPTTLFAVFNFPNALIMLRFSGAGFGMTSILLVYALYNVVYALTSYPAGILADRIPHGAVYGAGLVIFALGYAGMGFAHNTATLVVFFAIYGAYTGLTDGVGKAWVSETLAPSQFGRGIGLFQTLQGVGTLAAGVWAGVMMQGGGNPFVPSAAAALLIGITVIIAASRGRTPA